MNKIGTNTASDTAVAPTKKSRKKLVAILLASAVVLTGGVTAGTYFINSAAQQARVDAYDAAVLEHNEATAAHAELADALPEATYDVVNSWFTYAGEPVDPDAEGDTPQGKLHGWLNTVTKADTALISEETNLVTKELVEEVASLRDNDAYPTAEQITVRAEVVELVAQTKAELAEDTEGAELPDVSVIVAECRSLPWKPNSERLRRESGCSTKTLFMS